jgi:Xaa-Pro aminopeptidase
MKNFNFSGPIGIAGAKEVSIDIYDAVLQFGEVVVADEIIENIAMEKTPAEVDRARKAGKIADAGFNAFIEYSRPGIREYELVAEMEYAMRTAGADDNFTLISSNKHNYAMHPAYDKRLEWGDIVIGEISPVFEGQVVQLCRTLVLGKVNSVLKEKYDMLLNALKKSQEQIRSGIPASAMSIAMNKVISDAGYAKYCEPPYMRARGHGFSLGSIAPGATIDNNTKQNFQKDQLVVVHPNQYLPETGYLACGESVLVTDQGFERVSETETILYSKGA